jgi:phospholipase A1
MTHALESADPNMTIADLREQCKKQIKDGTYDVETEFTEVAVVEDRMRHDRKHVLQPFTLMTHKPNYILIGAYNGSGYDPKLWQEAYNEPDLQWEDTEAQFQLSVKFPLLVNLFDDTFDIYGAYTNRSFWQIYDEDSAPFRETNHEPEVWVQFHPGWELWGFKNTWNSFGLNHQSNGQGGVLSRSWNRVFAWFTVERGNLAMSIKPWYRIPESDSSDDNPDIGDFMGHYELSASYKWGENVFSLMSRNNLESGFSKGAVQASWSFPLWDWPYLKGYVQWFSGYGQSLIEYDQYANTIGVGFSLTDWL